MQRDGHVSKLAIRRIGQTNRNMTQSLRLSQTCCNSVAYDTSGLVAESERVERDIRIEL